MDEEGNDVPITSELPPEGPSRFYALAEMRKVIPKTMSAVHSTGCSAEIWILVKVRRLIELEETSAILRSRRVAA